MQLRIIRSNELHLLKVRGFLADVGARDESRLLLLASMLRIGISACMEFAS